MAALSFEPHMHNWLVLMSLSPSVDIPEAGDRCMRVCVPDISKSRPPLAITIGGGFNMAVGSLCKGRSQTAGVSPTSTLANTWRSTLPPDMTTAYLPFARRPACLRSAANAAAPAPSAKLCVDS